jgi:hypothetical protein
MVKKMKEKLVNLTYTPYLAMVAISPNLEYGPYEDHTFTNPISVFALSIQLTHLLQDGLVKLCNNQSMFYHTTLGIPHGIIYLGQ